MKIYCELLIRRIDSDGDDASFLFLLANEEKSLELTPREEITASESDILSIDVDQLIEALKLLFPEKFND